MTTAKTFSQKVTKATKGNGLGRFQIPGPIGYWLLAMPSVGIVNISERCAARGDARPPRQGRIIQLARRQAEGIPVRIFKEYKTSPRLFLGFTEKLDSAGLELGVGLVDVVGVKHNV